MVPQLRRNVCLFDRLLKRGLLNAIYPESQEFRSKVRDCLQSPVTVYAGFDATFESLHVGNLATIMNLIHFQRSGHKVICLIGDATALVGDPSGHISDRLKIDNKIVDFNAKSIEESLYKIFRNHRDNFTDNRVKKMQDPIIVRNSSWYDGKNIIQFVSDIFREVRVGSLLHKKAISDRLKLQTGMNMSEFCYQIFQAYDWIQLRERYDCRFQLGGSDQAGNIYTGHDMIKKIYKSSDAIGLLGPLVEDSVTGKKLGKSRGTNQGSIWLKETLTSPYNLYQFFHQTPDVDVEKFLKVYSLFEDDVIEELIQNHLKKPTDVWYCQRRLSEHVTKLVHGEIGLNSAKRITNARFNQSLKDIASLDDEDLKQVFDENSITCLLHHDQLTVLDLMRRSRCVEKDSDAEVLVRSGMVWINDALVKSINAPITVDLILGRGVTLMKIGKKRFYLFKWVN